jgi:hypothetical protein
MQHMILMKTDAEPAVDAQACKDLPEMVALLDRLRRDGVLVATEALRSTRSASRVRRTVGGDFAVVDGPFAEAKELVGGFVIVRADRAAAIDIARQILAIARPGVTAEVREVAGEDPVR